MTKRANHDKCSRYCLFKGPRNLEEDLAEPVLVRDFCHGPQKRSVVFLHRVLRTCETYRAVADAFAMVLNVSFVRQTQQATFVFCISASTLSDCRIIFVHCSVDRCQVFLDFFVEYSNKERFPCHNLYILNMLSQLEIVDNLIKE